MKEILQEKGLYFVQATTYGYIQIPGQRMSVSICFALIAKFDTPEKLADGLPVIMDLLHTHAEKGMRAVHCDSRIFYTPAKDIFSLRYKVNTLDKEVLEWIRTRAYPNGIYIHYGMFSKGRFCSDWCFPPE